MTMPLDSATPISYKTGIFRQSEYIFFAFFALFSRNPPYFYFRSDWPNFLKSGTHVALVKWIPSTKFEVDPTIHYRDMCCVTLWPWQLTFWPWTVFGIFLWRDLTFHQIWASYDHPFLSYDVHTLTAVGNTNSLLAIVHAQYHVTYLQGVDINHIFETHDPYLSIRFATYMALRRRLTSVIHKNSVQPMLKAKKLTVHVPYHVTYRSGVKNNYIFGIPDPDLAIHCDTFTGLWWRVRGVYFETANVKGEIKWKFF